jgi:Transglycosylase SLT domain
MPSLADLVLGSRKRVVRSPYTALPMYAEPGANLLPAPKTLGPNALAGLGGIPVKWQPMKTLDLPAITGAPIDWSRFLRTPIPKFGGASRATAPAGRAFGPGNLQQAANRAAAKLGLPVSWVQSPALWSLLKRESGLNPGASNPSSSAYGLFQFLNSTWASTGYRRSADPYVQFLAGLTYIRRTYGSPARAWAFWQATVNRNPNLAPADLRAKVRAWLARGYRGY